MQTVLKAQGTHAHLLAECVSEEVERLDSVFDEYLSTVHETAKESAKRRLL